MCYNETNLCDLHPVCDNATDEDWNRCGERYNFRKGATFFCQSPHHNEDTVKAGLSRGVVWIMAVPEDGIPECWNNADEQTNLFLTYVIPGNMQYVSANILLKICFLLELATRTRIVFPSRHIVTNTQYITPLVSVHIQYIPTLGSVGIHYVIFQLYPLSPLCSSPHLLVRF